MQADRRIQNRVELERDSLAHYDKTTTKQCTKCKAIKPLKEFYKNQKSKCRECVKRYNRQYLSHRRAAYPEYTLWEKAQTRAKKHGILFTITPYDVNIPTHCPILGIPLIKGKGRHCDNSPSLDRVDPTKGYTPDNIAVISYRANQIKNNGTAEEHRKIARFIDVFKSKGQAHGQTRVPQDPQGRHEAQRHL